LVLVMVMCAASAISAPRGGGGGHAAAPRGGGGHAVARVGSVHYGAAAGQARGRPAAREGRPAAREGAVHSEHYAGGAYRGAGGYRNPYRAEYFSHFRPGYYPYYLNGAQYYGYNDLPIGYQTVVINGITYYLFDGVYYLPYIYGGQTVYLVAPDQ
jgi:hypothetical protein